MKCLFVTDLHGKRDKYEKLFENIEKEKPDAVFLGGDLLPNNSDRDIKKFLDEVFFLKIKKIRSRQKKGVRFFVILGNDDPQVYEKIFIDSTKKGNIDYIHNKIVKFNNFFIGGYSYVPPTPFRLKDWEKYDISRFVDVGAISPEEGIRTVNVDLDEVKYSTISEDLKKLSKNLLAEKTIFLFHCPPYKSFLDRALLDEKKVEHAPVDVHVGSIAIRRFIEEKQPLLTLHGHVHETVSLTGRWVEKIGKTYCFSACHDGKELSVVSFDTNKLEDAVRKLI